MNRFLLVALFVVLAVMYAPGVHAQLNESVLTAQRAPVRINVMGQYQRYRFEGSHLTEASVPLTVSIPLGREFSLGLRTSIAGASSGLLEDVRGLSDVMASLTYAGSLGAGTVVASLAGSIPSGTEELSLAEFNTMILVSQVYYRFRVPAFGQGYSLIPSINWAVPAGRNVVLGIGFTYQINGAFRPVADMLDKYKPGSHFLVVAGVDVRLNPVSSISGDVKYAHYASDKLGSQAWYTAGDRISSTLQFKHYFGFDELNVVARYQTHADGANLATPVLSEQNVRAMPEHAGIAVRFSKRITGGEAVIGLLAAARYYGATDAGIGLAGERISFDKQRLVDLGVFSEIPVSEMLDILLSFSGTAGTFSGINGGVGVRVSL